MMGKKSGMSRVLNESMSIKNVAQCHTSKREHMIAYVAYLRAEKRGFAPNNDKADWFAAEAEIDRHLISFSS